MLIYTNSYNFLQIYDDLSSTNNTVADKAHTNFTQDVSWPISQLVHELMVVVKNKKWIYWSIIIHTKWCKFMQIQT